MPGPLAEPDPAIALFLANSDSAPAVRPHPGQTEVDKLYDDYWSAKVDSGWSQLIGER